VTDTEMLNATSYAGTLKITNFNPHYNYEVGSLAHLSNKCPGINEPLYIKVPQGTFNDDDLHHLYYDLKLSNGLSLPIDNIFYDPFFNTLLGAPTLKSNYYSLLTASDGFVSAKLDLNLFLSQAPAYVPVECQKLSTFYFSRPV
jgi:hypothetical protein